MDCKGFAIESGTCSLATTSVNCTDGCELKNSDTIGKLNADSTCHAGQGDGCFIRSPGNVYI